MCGIAGAAGVPDPDSNVGKMLAILRHRGPDGLGIHSSGNISIGNTLLKITGDMPQPLVGTGAFVLNGEIFNFLDLAAKSGIKTNSDTEMLFSLIEAGTKAGNTPIDSVYFALSQANGDYALAYACGAELVLARDPVGVKPLFYGLGKRAWKAAEEDKGTCGWKESPQIYFASEKKAVKYLGGGFKSENENRPGKSPEIRAFPPGTVLGFNTETGETAEKTLKIAPPAKRISGEEEAVSSLRAALKKAVELRLTPYAGIAFSGGIDSTFLAALAKRIDPRLALYAVGLPGSHDVSQAESAAEALGMKASLRVHFLSRREIEATVPKVIYATGSTDPMEIAIGIPLYIVAKTAGEEGKKVLLTGQGADELFGGYRRHESFMEEGPETLAREIYSDIENISWTNLERDDMVTMANAVELRVPFLDKDVLKVGLAISPELKVLKKAGGYTRKYILRKAAEGLLPKELFQKEKKAMQYGTGVQKILERLAKDAGFSKTEGKHLEKYLHWVAGEKGIITGI